MTLNSFILPDDPSDSNLFYGCMSRIRMSEIGIGVLQYIYTTFDGYQNRVE